MVDDELSSAVMNPTILRSRYIDLLIFGDAKRDVLDRAGAGDDILEMPAWAVLRQTQVPTTIWPWIMCSPSAEAGCKNKRKQHGYICRE